jgi:hypothetical protein
MTGGTPDGDDESEAPTRSIDEGVKRRYERLQELDGELERPDDFRLVRVPITDPAYYNLSVDHIATALAPPVESESAFSMCGQFSTRYRGLVSAVRSRCRRRTAADATALPLTTVVPVDGQLPEEPVVKWLVRWNSPAHTERCPDCSQHHLTELCERPPPEAAPAAAGRRHVLPVEIAPTVLKQQAHDKHH